MQPLWGLIKLFPLKLTNITFWRDPDVRRDSDPIRKDSSGDEVTAVLRKRLSLITSLDVLILCGRIE